jgi:hypothetical protein
VRLQLSASAVCTRVTLVTSIWRLLNSGGFLLPLELELRFILQPLNLGEPSRFARSKFPHTSLTECKTQWASSITSD